MAARVADRATRIRGVLPVKQRLAATFCLLLAAACPALANTDPYVPADDGVVLEHVPPASHPAVKQMTTLRRRLTANPDDRDLAVKLARAYIDFGRHRGDARYLGYAEAVIAPWLQADHQLPLDIALLNATLLQSRHHFEAAEKALKRIIQHDPDNRQAWLTLATAATVQAKFDLARTACAHLLTVSDRLVSAGCIAGLASVIGGADEAYDLLGRLTSTNSFAGEKKLEGDAARAIRAWIEGLMADAAKRLGRDAAAEKHFRAALELTPGDNFLLADYADFLLDQHRPRDVIKLLKDYQRSDTSFLRYVFAEAELGLPGAEADIDAMAGRFAALDRRGSHVYRREQARFVLRALHDPERALKLAAQNWRVQRAPWDIRVYLAAALAAKQPRAALPALKVYESSGLHDPHIAPLAAKLRAQLNQVVRQ
ncbi:MAG TPA: hypothetical protein VFK45_01985 [Gammaproteobacteria bacterium]|nr:hypothetical protein [Gammaproteobacteria bacterium]